MSTTKSLDLDAYEGAKLRLLLTEKLGGFLIALMIIVGSLVFCMSLFVMTLDLLATRFTPNGILPAAIKADFWLLPLTSIILILAVLAGVYLNRSTTQIDLKKFRGARSVLVIIAAIWILVPIGKLMLDSRESGQNPLIVLLYFGQWFWDIALLYISHWSSVLALLVGPALELLALGRINRRSPLKLISAIEGEDRRFMRDNPEGGFLRGRVFRSAVAIPRIVDFVPHGQSRLVVLFFVGYAFYGLQLSSLFIYVMILSYPLLAAMAYSVSHCPDAQTLFECANPVFSEYASLWWLAICLMVFPLVIVAPILGGFFCSMAQRRIRFSILELTKVDGRKPILFLRPFKDDRVQLGQARLSWGARIGRWLDHISDIDRMLLEEGTPYGPVVAIGRPGDKLPPYVVARGSFTNDTWQPGVLALAEKSMAIILCASDSEGVWWEIKNVAARYPDKTLVLVHPSHRGMPDNAELLGKVATIMERAVPGLRASVDTVPQKAGARSTVLGFYTEADGHLNVGRSSTFSRLAFLMMLRLFLRKKWGLALSS